MMSFRDIWNAIEGHADAKKQEYAVLFDISKYNASRTASHKEQLKKIRQDRNPYNEKRVPKAKKAHSFNDMIPLFRGITGKT